MGKPKGVAVRAHCTLCDFHVDTTQEQCDKYPGYVKGCLYKLEGNKPINGWVCDGKGNLTRTEDFPHAN